MEENNNENKVEVENNNNINNNNNNSSNGSVIFPIILLILCIGLGYYIYKNNDTLFKQKSKNTEVNNSVKEDTTVASNTKDKLDRFINAALSDDIAKNYNVFLEGVSSLTKEQKFILAYNDLFINNKVSTSHIITEEEVSTMTTSFDKNGVNNPVGEIVSVMKVSEFDDCYLNLFNEKSDYTVDEIKNYNLCPLPWGIDKSKDAIYLFHRCGGVSETEFNFSIESYIKDGDTYYVYTKGEDVNTSTNTVVNTYNTVWKFDKDLNFISTEKE